MVNVAPLKSLRILSVEQYGAGPFGTQFLSDLGADVIKIEDHSMGGDMARTVGPYFIENDEPSIASLFFQSLNRNKRSICLDLKSDEGRSVFRRLAANADGILTNLRGDVPAKLGLTYRDLCSVNRKLVCSHLTAYGREGERASWPGYDYLMQAEIGYFELTGDPEGPPSRMGLSIVDLMAGLMAVFALLTGIIDARESGKGRDIDVSLFDTALFNLNYIATWFFANGHNQKREHRSAHPSLVPCQLYKTSDGWVYLMCNKEKFWSVLCQAIEKIEWIEDPRFATFNDRLGNKDLLTNLLDSVLVKKTTKQWLEVFQGLVPAAPILDVATALSTPLVKETGRKTSVVTEKGNLVELLRCPVKTDMGDLSPTSAPRLGAHSEQVLTEFGFSQEEILRLKSEKVIHFG